METKLAFNKYMDSYFEFVGHWESPSRCGLKIIGRKDGKILGIATEIYRQNPGTPVTEWCAPLATQIMKTYNGTHERFIFVEHTPDMKSKQAFLKETFDLVNFDWDGDHFINPRWTRLTIEQVDKLMEE